MFNSGRSCFLGRSQIRLAPNSLFIKKFIEMYLVLFTIKFFKKITISYTSVHLFKLRK